MRVEFAFPKLHAKLLYPRNNGSARLSTITDQATDKKKEPLRKYRRARCVTRESIDVQITLRAAREGGGKGRRSSIKIGNKMRAV